MRIIISILIFLFLISSAQAAISEITVVTNLSSSDRAIMGTNSTLNFSFVESAGNNYTNITFPSAFNFTDLVLADIVNNTVASSISISTTMVNITYPARASGAIYFNFTANMKTPAAAGDYIVSIKTNATTSPANVTLYVRNSSRPYYVKANNSVFVVGTETFGEFTTTIPLTGTGSANLTIYAPNITGQTNITVGYGATNITSLSASFTNLANQINTIYVITDSTVVNPVITLGSVKELESSNIPAAIIAGGVITVILVLYKVRRRTR